MLNFQLIDESNTVYGLYPVNEDIVFTDTKENEQIFFRRKINNLTFLASNYKVLKNLLNTNPCQQYRLDILFGSTVIWQGVFNMRKGNWSDRLCRLQMPVEPRDPAYKVLSTWEQKYNIFTMGTSVTVYPFIGTIECQECILFPPTTPATWILSSPITAQCSPSLSPSQGWTITRNEVNGVTQVSSSPPIYRAELNVVTRYCREFVAGSSTPPGSGWVAVSGGYARTVVTILDNNKSDFDPSDNKLLQYYNVVGLDTETGDQQPVDNGILFKDILSFFVAKAGLTRVVSDFFNINPDGTAPSNSAYTASNPNLHNLCIFQKSDVKRPGAYENATRGELSFKEVLDMLRETFQVYWRVSGTDLRLEHISYYQQSNGTDLTAVAPGQIKNLNDFSWKENKLAALEQFKWMDETQINDFAGYPIVYEDGCADPTLPPVTHNPGSFYTDIQTAQRQPNLVQDAGFVLANLAYYNLKYYFIQENGYLSGVRWVNGHLAWANLHNNYWKYKRPFAQGKMNNVLTSFFITEKIKQQQELKVPLSVNSFVSLTPEDNMKSEMGWGETEKLTYSTTKCLLSVSLNQ